MGRARETEKMDEMKYMVSKANHFKWPKHFSDRDNNNLISLKLLLVYQNIHIVKSTA